MDKYFKGAPKQEGATVSKPKTNKSITHFNWFARFETQQMQRKDSLKS